MRYRISELYIFFDNSTYTIIKREYKCVKVNIKARKMFVCEFVYYIKSKTFTSGIKFYMFARFHYKDARHLKLRV